LDLNTFFLGIIAVCMIFITIGMFLVSFMGFLILKVLKELLIEIRIDYKVMSPKVNQILENLENTTAIFSLLSIFRRRKKKQ
jgi:hypothetical protein